VTDNSQIAAATVVGAVIGGLAAYLLFTEHGRSFKRQWEPMLDDVARELSSFRNTMQKAASVASEGWRLFEDVVGENSRQAPRYPSPHQSSPF
jgi:hypothetical protein